MSISPKKKAARTTTRKTVSSKAPTGLPKANRALVPDPKKKIRAADYSHEFAQAQQFELAGRFAEAEHLYREITRLNPRHAAAWHALGILYFQKGDLSQAIDLVRHAAQLAPKELLFFRNLGEMLRRAGNIDESIKVNKTACKLGPTDVECFYNLGLVYTDARDFPKAIKAYRQAIKLNPRHGLSWNNLGAALEQLDDKARALQAYKKAVEINPQHAEALNNQGAIQTEQGFLDDAKESFHAAVNCRPDFVEAHYNLSSLKKYTPNDPHLAMLRAVLSQESALPYSARIRYHFALGKALDDVGDYDNAFQSYALANRLQHAILPYDEVRAEKLMEDILSVFTKEFFQQREGWQGSDKSPIFIVGMPRSGTTLLEQILCSHNSVYGAGELSNFNEAVNEFVCVDADKWFTEFVAGLDQFDINALARKYVSGVWKLSPESEFITDKMPANFFYIGLIHLAFPKAKIIHAMRDPLDSCFSCYSRLFNDTMEFAYDLETLGNYYRRYHRVMEHWHRVLPKGRILDLHYEELVADVEGQSKRILEYVGLPWDPACLEFYKNDRLVQTASVAQVRQPIYKSSVARWKHFEKHLTPLINIVGLYRQAADGNSLPATTPETNVTNDDGNLLQRCLELQSKNEHTAVLDYIASLKNIRPDLVPHLLHLRGISLYRLNRFVEARQNYEMVLREHPNFPQVLNSYGFLLQDMGFIKEAKSAFAKAVKIAPEFSMARLNLGMAQLKLGDWEHGWDNYESRWTGSAEAAQPNFFKPSCNLPFWDGESGTANHGLLVIAEQGFGDTFQFARYLTLAKKHFAKVGFVCSLPTMRLLEWSMSEDVILLHRIPSDLSTWQWHIPLLSLPRSFKTRVESIPAEVPYFKTPPTVKSHWSDKVRVVAGGRLKVGIAWAGRPSHQYDRRRSIAFELIQRLLPNQNIVWFSLQKWSPEDLRPQVPANVNWVDWTDDLMDFADTAGLIENLDLVISIDSSMIHLAGALGKPVWMLNRFDSEWRWFDRQNRSPWYPSLRIFNQSQFGNWQSVIDEVGQAINQLSPCERAPHEVINQPVQVMPPSAGQVLTPEQAMQLAAQLQASGRIAEAERILTHLLEKDSRNHFALHLLGVIYFQKGQVAQGLELISNAIGIAPNNALYYSNLTEIYRQLGRLNDAVLAGQRAIQIDPMLASAYSNLGVALFDLKRFDDSEKAHQQALAIQPGLLQSLNTLGSIERARKNRSKAIEWYQLALQTHPEFLESLNNLGAVLVESDRAEEAVPLLQRALQLKPDYAEAICNLGLAKLKLEENEQAIALFQRSLQLKPNYPEAMTGLGRAFYESDRLLESKELLEKVVQASPEKVDALSQLGIVLTELGESHQAEEVYAKAITLDPDFSEPICGLGNLKLEAGDVAQAESLFKKAIDIDPSSMDARFHLIQSRKVKEGDANVLALEAMVGNSSFLRVEKQISLHYALGKAYDDLKLYDKAFKHFEVGAKLKRSKLSYDSGIEAEHVNQITELFTPQFMADKQGGGNPSAMPIFVLGMPRSGTTLTEQILASHPKVSGAGELHSLSELAQGLATPEQSYLDIISQVDQKQLTALGDSYIQRLQRYAHDKPFVTDKMPSNYFFMGLIPLILPHAKIIHVKRNPIDTCLSCYTRLFNRHQSATYDLTDLGHHYQNYEKLMKHWKSVMSPGSIHEVQYENMVVDIEGESRRLLEFCDLEWDDACLDFYKNKRPIRTASVTQVREPIYASSVERWRHYEAHLGPLLEALKDHF